MAEKRKVIVLQNEDAPIPVEIMAEAIVEISAAARTILNGPLTKRAIVLLIHDKCAGRVGKREIEDVLDSAEMLGQFYVRKRTE